MSAAGKGVWLKNSMVVKNMQSAKECGRQKY